MSKTTIKYVIGSCPFCQQGHLGMAACGNCHGIVALCDECELLWTDVRGVHDVPETRSAGTYPNCPQCQTPEARWYWLTRAQVNQAGLLDCIES